MGSKMDALIKEMNKKAKEEIVTVGLSEYDYERIPFTSPRMNYCTYGGLPVGKIIEFYGEEHGGKTTTALDIVSNFQYMEREKAKEDSNYETRKVLYADCENTLDTEWAMTLGVDVDDMIILRPIAQSAEQIFQFIIDAVETDEIGLWVIDSLGVMLSQQELEKAVEDKTYGGISMALTRFCKEAEMLMHKHKCTGIGINQQRAKMNSPYGGMDTPGGKAWKFVCSVRLEFSRGRFFDENGTELPRGAESPVGNYVMMSMIKNKTCPPDRRTGFYTLRYATGIDFLSDLIEVAIKYGIINKAGAWFTIINTETGELLCPDKIQGQSHVYDLLMEDKELCSTVAELVDAKMCEK